MGFAEDVARAQLMQEDQVNPIDSAVSRFLEQRSRQPEPSSLMGIPDRVAMEDFPGFAGMVARAIPPNPLAASQAFLDALQRGYEQRSPFSITWIKNTDL